MNNDIAIAWLDGIRTNTKDADLREALLKGIEAIEKLEQNDKPSGKWINHKDEHQCSHCKEVFIVSDAYWDEGNYNYCPNCGANMVEEQGEQNG